MFSTKISSVDDIPKMVRAAKVGWEYSVRIEFETQSKDGYISAGCGNLNDTTGDFSFQLDRGKRFKGMARTALQQIRGDVGNLVFNSLSSTGPWCLEFLAAFKAEIPYAEIIMTTPRAGYRLHRTRPAK